jgi:hypothetical protein
LQGKIVHGGSFQNGNEEESKKEETLTVGETKLRTGQELNQPLRGPLLRGVSISDTGFGVYAWKTACCFFAAISAIVPLLQSRQFALDGEQGK